MYKLSNFFLPEGRLGLESRQERKPLHEKGLRGRNDLRPRWLGAPQSAHPTGMPGVTQKRCWTCPGVPKTCAIHWAPTNRRSKPECSHARLSGKCVHSENHTQECCNHQHYYYGMAWYVKPTHSQPPERQFSCNTWFPNEKPTSQRG